MNGKVTVANTTTALGVSNINTYSKVILTNDSDAVIYVSLNGPAVMNEGIRLNASGDRIVLDAEANGTTRITSINAICSAGGKVLSYCLI